MPRTKLDKPRYPPINDLRAAILERKFVSGMTWEDLGAVAGVKGATMRKLAREKPPQDWTPQVRNAVCRLLEIKINISIKGD